MKIAIASLGDPFDMGTWSGIPAHIVVALKRNQHTVSGIHLEKPEEPWFYNWYRRFYFRIQKKWFLSEAEPFILKKIAAQFDLEVNQIKPDVVISIHGDFLAYTTFKQPAIIVHDTTFASLLDYYSAFSSLTNRSIKAGNIMYQRALEKASAAVFSAEWASDSAKSDYNIAPSKIHTVPLGANLVKAPEASLVEKWIKERAEREICKFLFLGVDWERKGGPDALRIVIELNRKGIKAQLIIAGCSPVIDPGHNKYVKILGFLRKDNLKEAQTLEQAFIDSHALLLPSIAECYGCVYCEANAYGLPAIGRDTGGIPEIIKNGVNGFLLGKGQSPESFAQKWLELWENRELYTALSQRSRLEFEQRLNYDIFSEKLEQIMKQVLN